MFNAISSLINGAFGLVGKGIDWSLTKDQQELQNQYNLEMWNLNNEYNTPQNQMRRFEEAGLNPGLIYGQINPGNSSAAPQKGAALPPKFSEELKELGQAFNIEGLKTAIANRRKAEAEASIAWTEDHRNRDRYEAEITFGRNYQLDPQTGQFIWKPRDSTEKKPLGASSYYYINNLLSDNFRTNSLLVPRLNLMNSQRLLNASRQGMIAPQTRMLQYEQKYQPWTFWINNAKNAVGTVSPLLNFLPF